MSPLQTKGKKHSHPGKLGGAGLAEALPTSEADEAVLLKGHKRITLANDRARPRLLYVGQD